MDSANKIAHLRIILLYPSEFWSFSLEQFQVFTVRRICNNHKFAVEILQRSRAPGAAAVNKLLGDFKIWGGKNQ